jgi:hypothetical protein
MSLVRRLAPPALVMLHRPHPRLPLRMRRLSAEDPADRALVNVVDGIVLGIVPILKSAYAAQVERHAVTGQTP